MPIEQVVDYLLDLSREEGAAYPTFAQSTDDTPVIVDNETGRVWKVSIQEF